MLYSFEGGNIPKLYFNYKSLLVVKFGFLATLFVSSSIATRFNPYLSGFSSGSKSLMLYIISKYSFLVTA